MSSDTILLVQGVYDAFARGDIPAVLAAMSPDIVWNEAENFPYADKNPYVGPEAVLNGVFARLGGEWKGWSLKLDDMLDSGDTVVAFGRYSGTYKATGKDIRAQFVHVWSIADGKVVRFQQYTDTLQVARAMESA